MKRTFWTSAIFSALLALAGCQAQPPAAEAPTVSAQPAIVLPDIPAHTVSILDFGAIGDGKTDNAAAIGKAIAACAGAGGGHVAIPTGTWLTGPIHLMSHIDLHLDPGALLLFSRNFDDYPLALSNYEGQQTVMCSSPLSGDQLDDVSITGAGIIDGQGGAWRPVKKSKLTPAEWDALVQTGGVVDRRAQTWYPSQVWLSGQRGLTELRQSSRPLQVEDFQPYRDLLRPPLVLLSNCRRVLLEGPTFRNSASWNVHLLLSDNVTVRRVTIFNPYYAQNGDGIDIDSCQDVSVTNSDISAGDDVVCLKSGRRRPGRPTPTRPTQNVTIAHCTLGRGHGGIAIGSEMSGGVRNVEVYDCVLRGTDEALRFKTVRGRGGVVENVNIHDLEMWDITNSCISVDMYYMIRRPPTTRRGTTAPSADSDAPQPDPPVAKPLIVTQEPREPLGPGTPQFRGITIRNIVCHGANIAMQLRGLPELPLENVTIEHADIVSKLGGAIVDADRITLRDVHVKSAAVPVFQIQNATHLTMEDVDDVPQSLK
ncbi:MAG: glycoside hydrolase family 28 protein [Tepidisphaeraceae bacterium]|jgi:polygalacturonase